MRWRIGGSIDFWVNIIMLMDRWGRDLSIWEGGGFVRGMGGVRFWGRLDEGIDGGLGWMDG